MCMWTCVYRHIDINNKYVYRYKHIFICVHLYLYVYIHTPTYTYIHIYIADTGRPTTKSKSLTEISRVPSFKRIFSLSFKGRTPREPRIYQDWDTQNVPLMLRSSRSTGY